MPPLDQVPSKTGSLKLWDLRRERVLPLRGSDPGGGGGDTAGFLPSCPGTKRTATFSRRCQICPSPRGCTDLTGRSTSRQAPPQEHTPSSISYLKTEANEKRVNSPGAHASHADSPGGRHHRSHTGLGFV